MTLNDGFERTVTDWLDEQAGRGSPGYLDEVLIRTTRTRQRPWWSSPERWLPVQSTARFAQVPRMAWLLVVLGLIVALGTAILVAGSPRRPPSPFGPAAQGNVLYAGTDGDIYAIDTATNVARPLIVGPAARQRSAPLAGRDQVRVHPSGRRFGDERHVRGERRWLGRPSDQRDTGGLHLDDVVAGQLQARGRRRLRAVDRRARHRAAARDAERSRSRRPPPSNIRSGDRTVMS